MDFKKKQKFSIRKLTLGAASVLLGTSLVLGSAEAKAEEVATELSGKAEEKVKIGYLALNEKELNEIEKELIIREDISKEQAVENDTYVVVYKPKEEIKKVLPNTGISQNIINLILAGGLLVLVYRLGKKKSTLIGIAILTTVSGLGLNNAQAEEVLRSIANQVKVHEKTNNLEKLNIENYDYVGYIRDEEIPVNTRLKEIVEDYKIEQGINIKNEEITSEKPEEVIPEVQPGNPEVEPTLQPEEPKEPEVKPTPEPEEPSKPEVEPTPQPEEPKKPEVEPTPQPEEPGNTEGEKPESGGTVDSGAEEPGKPGDSEIKPTPEPEKPSVPEEDTAPKPEPQPEEPGNTEGEKPESGGTVDPGVEEPGKPGDSETKPTPEPEEPKVDPEQPNPENPSVPEEDTAPKPEPQPEESGNTEGEKPESGGTVDPGKEEPGKPGDSETEPTPEPEGSKVDPEQPNPENPSMPEEDTAPKPEPQPEEPDNTEGEKPESGGTVDPGVEEPGKPGDSETDPTPQPEEPSEPGTTEVEGGSETETPGTTEKEPQPEEPSEPGATEEELQPEEPEQPGEEKPEAELSSHTENKEVIRNLIHMSEDGKDITEIVNKYSGNVAGNSLKSSIEVIYKKNDKTGEVVEFRENVSNSTNVAEFEKFEHEGLIYTRVPDRDSTTSNSVGLGEAMYITVELENGVLVYKLNNSPYQQNINETRIWNVQKISLKEKVKPELVVTKVDTDDEARTATITYNKTDNDNTFEKVTINVYKGEEKVQTLENNTLENLSVTINDLDLYTKYKVETVVYYNLGQGETTETLDKKEEVELIPKRVEFRNVSSKELYKVSSDGSMSIVTGLTEAPSDKENYVVKLVNDGKEVVLPVASFKANGDKIDINIEHPKLVTFRSAKETEDNYKFQVDKIQTGNGIYTTFDSLISAMKANTSGEYKLGMDVYATDISTDAYVDKFSGTLKSVDGKKYAIIGLKKPLIKTLSGGTVENIELRNINITSSGDTGSVAIITNNGSKISKVKINGNIKYASSSPDSRYIGGVTSSLSGGSTVEKNYVDLNINTSGGERHKISLIVARSSSFSFIPGAPKSKIINNFSKGNIASYNSDDKSAIISNDYSSLSDIKDNISDSTLSLLGPGIHAPNNKKIGNGSNGTITKEDANKKLKEWGVIKEETPASSNNTTSSQFNYSVALNYDANKEKAYKNTEKLLPLYDRNTVVKYGNLIASGSNLATKNVVSVTPMKDDNFAVNLLDGDSPNKLFIKYDDNTYEIVDLTKVGNFKNTDIVEYSFNNNLLFTLNQFNKSKDDIVSAIKGKLETVDLNSSSISNLLDINGYNQKYSRADNPAKVSDLYLEKSLDEVKANLDTILPKLLSNNDITYLDNATIKKTIVKKVEDNKEKIMLGLSYLNRLYGINFDNFNIKDLVMFSPSFYGKNFDNIDYLIELGSQGFENLMQQNNVSNYERVLANKLGSENLLNFLDKNRTLFTKKGENEWFKSSTKAFTHEVKSKVLPEANVEIYNRLKQKDSYKSYILPLLNLEDSDVYVITTLSTIYFGGYGRSVDTKLKKTNPEVYKTKVAETNEKLKKESERWRDYNDFYLNISDDSKRQILKDKLSEVYDGYYIIDNERGKEEDTLDKKRRWADKYDREYNAVYDFFGPIGRWYAKSKNNNLAYAIRNDNRIHFDHVDILKGQGGAILNHELVHAYDEDVLLQGFKYREGQSTESYAYGLFESVTSATTYYYGFNFMYDINGGVHNNDISRFSTKEDLQSYAKGVSDVTYLVDGLEAEIIAAKSDTDKAKLLRKIEMTKLPAVPQGEYNHANDVIKDLTADEIKNMNLNSVNDFVERDLVAKTGHMVAKEYLRDNDNNYYIVPLYYPIYAGYQNDQGTVGGLMFRRVAFDMLAEYGWDKGFVGYASNKLKPSDNIITDDVVFNSILAPEYKGSYKAFKKDMFKKRLDKKDQIKEITVKGQKITSGQQLKALLEAAINEDLQKGETSFARQNLKAEILREFNKITDNFRSSIFKS